MFWKNWKSTFAFFIFIGVYIYTVCANKSDNVIDTAGFIALYSSIFMMFRSQFTSNIIARLVNNIRIGG